MLPPLAVQRFAWLGGKTPPIPIVLRVRVKYQASGVVGYHDKPAPRNFRSIDISQFPPFASRTGRLQFVPDDLWWFCFLCRVRAFLHVRYPFALVSPLFYASFAPSSSARISRTVKGIITQIRLIPAPQTGVLHRPFARHARDCHAAHAKLH